MEEEAKDVVIQEKKSKKKKPLWLKIVLWVLLGILVLLIGTLIFIDTILTTGIRTGGSLIMKTKVEVDSVSLRPLLGTLDIKGLRVFNPPDFKDGCAIELPSFHVGLEVKSLLTNKIIVNKVEIVGIKVNYEPTIKGGSNLQAIVNNMDDPNKKPPAEATKDKKAAEGAAKTVVIKELNVSEGGIGITMFSLTTPIPLPPIKMTGIGEKSDVTMAQAVSIFFKELLASVVNVSSQVVGNVGSAVKSAGSTIGSGISSGAQSVSDGVKGIFSSGEAAAKQETAKK